MVITDLDGTLLKNNKSFCENDLNTLFRLGEKNYCRTIATGRSLFSLQKIIYDNFPVDYVVFSSGAGIMNWKTKQIIFKQNLLHHEYLKAYDLLHDMKLDFMLHFPIPENHWFHYFGYNNENKDFYDRIEIYKEYAIKGKNGTQPFAEACQLLAINDHAEIYEKIKLELSELKVIRATSPLNHTSIWIEIFHNTVSKGFAAIWLCKFLNISMEATLGIGNDYNDFDLLEETNHSYVVANAPDDLKLHFEMTDSNDENGFSKAVKKSFGI